MTTFKKPLQVVRSIAATALLIALLPKIIQNIMPLFLDISEIIVRTLFAPVTTFVEMLAKFHIAHGTGVTTALLFVIGATAFYFATRNIDKKEEA